MSVTSKRMHSTRLYVLCMYLLIKFMSENSLHKKKLSKLIYFDVNVMQQERYVHKMLVQVRHYTKRTLYPYKKKFKIKISNTLFNGETIQKRKTLL